MRNSRISAQRRTFLLVKSIDKEKEQAIDAQSLETKMSLEKIEDNYGRFSKQGSTRRVSS